MLVEDVRHQILSSSLLSTGWSKPILGHTRPSSRLGCPNMVTANTHYTYRVLSGGDRLPQGDNCARSRAEGRQCTCTKVGIKCIGDSRADSLCFPLATNIRYIQRDVRCGLNIGAGTGGLRVRPVGLAIPERMCR